VTQLFLCLIKDHVQYRYVKEPYFRWMPDAMFRALEHQFGWHLCLTGEAV